MFKMGKHSSGFLAIVAILGLGLLFTGCGTAGKQDQTSSQAPKTFVVANWKGYGSDQSYAVQTFEKKYNVKVVHQYFNSEEELLNMLRTGGVGKIDVVLPNLAYVQPAVNEGLIQPIDTSKLTNFQYLYKKLQNLPDVKGKDGQTYAVPWVWGTTSLAYNNKIIANKLDSWAALWDPQYKGKIAFFDDPTTAIMTAALYLGEDPYNPDLSKVKQALLQQKKLVKTYWSSADDWTKLFTSNEIVVGNAWFGLSRLQISNGDPLTYVYPKEGAIGWVDNWAIVSNSPNKDLAYKWIDFMISEEFQKQYYEDPKAEAPAIANEKAVNDLDPKIKNAMPIDPKMLDSLVMQGNLPTDTLKKWTALWEEVKASS